MTGYTCMCVQSEQKVCPLKPGSRMEAAVFVCACFKFSCVDVCTYMCFTFDDVCVQKWEQAEYIKVGVCCRVV